MWGYEADRIPPHLGSLYRSKSVKDNVNNQNLDKSKDVNI